MTIVDHHPDGGLPLPITTTAGAVDLHPAVVVVGDHPTTAIMIVVEAVVVVVVLVTMILLPAMGVNFVVEEVVAEEVEEVAVT